MSLSLDDGKESGSVDSNCSQVVQSGQSVCDTCVFSMEHNTVTVHHSILAIVDHGSSRDQGALVCDLLIVMSVQTGVTTSQDGRGSTRDHLFLVGVKCIFQGWGYCCSCSR